MGYSPWGCKRVRHNLETKQHTSQTYLAKSCHYRNRKMGKNSGDKINKGAGLSQCQSKRKSKLVSLNYSPWLHINTLGVEDEADLTESRYCDCSISALTSNQILYPAYFVYMLQSLNFIFSLVMIGIRKNNYYLQRMPLEKGMATHSSILAWKIPWTEKAGRLLSMGSQNRTRLSN